MCQASAPMAKPTKQRKEEVKQSQESSFVRVPKKRPKTQPSWHSHGRRPVLLASSCSCI